MQKYKEINGNDYVKNSRTTINETMRSIQSMNSGTAFPTTNLFEGMKCYRTDLKKTYTLTDVENNTWVEDAHAELADEATHAASATKLQTPRALNLSGAVTADAASFDGTADATINVKTLDASKLKGTTSVSTAGNAATATKLATARTIALSGNATGSTTFDGSGNVTINVTVNESAHAAKATQDTNGRAFTDTNAYMHISYLANGTDFNNVKTTGIYYCTQDTFPNRPHNSWGILTVYSIGTVKQEYKPDNAAVYYTRESNNSNWTAWSKVAASTADTCTGNAATASKLASPRTLSLTGKAAGSTSFDGSTNATINVTSVNADTASKLSSARKINITGNATGAATFDGSSDASINVTVNESKHAVNADNAGHANNVTDAVINYGVSGVGEGTTAMASGVISNLSGLTGSNDLTSMNKLRSYIGSVNANSNWYDVISVRHRNSSEDGQNFGLLMYSDLTNTNSIKYKKQPNGQGWTEERTLLDSSNYNSYAPTKTGAGASGTWGINISGTAAKADGLTGNLNFPGIGNVGTSNKISWNGSTDGADIYYQTTASDQGNLVLNLRDDDNCYLRIACNGAFKSYFSPSDGNFHGNVNGNADTATNADTVDGVHAGSMFYNKGNWGADNWGTIGAYEVNNNPPVSDAYPWGQVISISTTASRFQLYASHTFGGTGRLYYKTGYSYDKSSPWNTILDSENYNLFAPTKTGGGASGTWGINISGNADTVDGYHASDIINRISAANTGGIVAASLTENGYVKFANGLILTVGNN